MMDNAALIGRLDPASSMSLLLQGIEASGEALRDVVRSRGEAAAGARTGSLDTQLAIINEVRRTTDEQFASITLINTCGRSCFG